MKCQLARFWQHCRLALTTFQSAFFMLHPCATILPLAIALVNLVLPGHHGMHSAIEAQFNYTALWHIICRICMGHSFFGLPKTRTSCYSPCSSYSRGLPCVSTLPLLAVTSESPAESAVTSGLVSHMYKVSHLDVFYYVISNCLDIIQCCLMHREI